MKSEEEKNQKNQDSKSQTQTAKRTYLLILLLALIATGLLAIAFIPKVNAPPVTTTVKPIQSPVQTTLVISSNPIQDKVNPLKYTVDIAIDSGQNNVTAVQLELSYNPKALTNVDITPGTFFNNPNILLKKIDPVNGRITYALGVSLGQKGISGQKNVAQISFFVVPGFGTTPIAINFDPKTSVSAEGYAQSVVKDLTGSLFTIKQAKPSPTSPTSQTTGTTSAK
jgi:hypothetical protein